MFAFRRAIAVRLIQAMLGTGGLADGAMGAETAVECAIHSESVSGGVALEAVVTARPAIEGTYALSVSGIGGGGSSSISQGGRFTAGPAGAARLGSVTLGPGTYSVRLHVEWPGGRTSCSRTAAG